MSFLAPLFLLGAVAVAGPVIFHLIRKTVKERVRFSTLMFLEPSPPRLTKRSRLENILLLLMRCAVICLLAVGFARPYMQHSVAEPPKPNSGRRVIVLLDTSASMRRNGLWDAAKSTARAAIQKVDANDSVSLIAFDQTPHMLISFDQWRKTPVAERINATVAQIDSAQPSWRSTHLGKALTTAGESSLDASRADAEGATRAQIIVVSDFQQGAHLDGLQGFEWPRGVEVVLQTVGAAQAANAGVQLLPVASGESLSTTNNSIRARVVNSSGAKDAQFKVGWAATNSANFLGASVETHVPGGQNRSVAMPAPPTNIAQLSVLLTGDAEAFDNRAYFAAPPKQTLRIAFIGRDQPDDPNGQLFYLRRAFPDTATMSVRIDARPPGTNSVIDANLAIVTELGASDVPLLRSHLDAGKTILFVLGEKTDFSGLAALTGGGAPTVSEGTGSFVLLGQIEFEHPLFSQFRDARFNDFTRIHFWKHRKLDTTAIPKARAIASFDDNSPALLQLPTAKGALYLLTAGWNPTDSQLALSTKFLPLIYALLEQSSPAATQTLQLTVGDPIPFPGDFNGDSIALTKPDGAKVDWKKGDAFANTDQPGFYSSAQPNLLFAVNLDPAESRTTPIPEETLAGLGLPLKRDEVPISAEAKKQHEQLLLATEQESRQKLWRRLLLFALAILLAESIFGAFSSRRRETAAA